MTEEQLLSPLMPLIQALELEFNDIWLLREALTHRSFLNEHPDLDNINSNQRLELLGDAVISLMVKEHLFVAFPNKDEGEITALVTQLTNNERFGEIGRRLKLGSYLLASGGDIKNGITQQAKANADALEALIDAIYMDQGFRRARLYVDNLILRRLREILKTEPRDPTERLQKETQAKYHQTPYYKTVSVKGPAHNPEYTVAVCIDVNQLAEGIGPSKRKARMNAAQNALNTHFPNRRRSS